MHTYQSTPAVAEREARTGLAESVYDSSYERTTAALRRWVDGMEAALAHSAPRKTKEVRK